MSKIEQSSVPCYLTFRFPRLKEKTFDINFYNIWNMWNINNTIPNNVRLK